MRLNRVLLLAASFICMALAMVFTISCSGDDGKDGSLKSCTLQGSMSADGLDVMCEGTRIGTIPPGPQGPAGQTGPQGPAGTLPPEYCKIGSQDPATGKWGIICNGQQIGDDQITGQLDNCTTNDKLKNSGIFTIKCPNNPEDIYLCGGVPYNPAENHCEPFMASADNNGPAQRVFVILPSWCGTTSQIYDSRTHFCDGATIRELCGGDTYKSSAPDNERCDGVNVTKACIGSTSRYIKRTQFCMLNASNTAGVVTARCGTSNDNGVFPVGTAESGDKYNGLEIKGEYRASKNELCQDGKVVLRCGNEVYEEKTHFCATGNAVTPHCDDRIQYNPTQRFCSYRANPAYNPTSTACKDDPEDITCKEYASTAMVFCGGTAATPAVENRYNVGSWLWEYCVPKKNPSSSAAADRVLFSVLRCSALQVPDGVAAAETCKCIPNADRIPGGNACQCSQNLVAKQFKAFILQSNTTASQGFALLSGYTLPGVASAGVTGIAQPQITLPAITVGNTTVSFASGLPYNYTVGSGLELNYGADKGFLSNSGATAAAGAASYGVGIFSSTTINGVANQFYDIIPAYIGGSCLATAPSCGGVGGGGVNSSDNDLSKCTSANCYSVGGGVWDTPTSSCVADADACTNGFGVDASTHVCRDSQGKCEANGALDQCATYSTCKTAGGFWDIYLLRNRCRNTRSECISGGAAGVKENGSGGTTSSGTTSSGDANLCDKPN